MGSELMYYIPVMGVVGLVVMIAKAMWVNKQDAGDANMQELAGYIARGASAFLKAEWKVLGVFAAIAAVLLAWSGTLVPHSDWVIAIAFLIGAFFSAFAGWIGMSIATKANVRTTQAARTSLAQGPAGELQRRHRDGPRCERSGRGGPQHLFIVFLRCT
jgi:K(+)-stimulated pyrophosphate-energized sodium pump